MKKILIYCGVNNLVNFNNLRPHYDVCYGFDANPAKIEHARTVYEQDPYVHFIFGALTERGGEEVEFNITDNWDPSLTLGTFNPDYGHIKTGLLVPQTKIKVPTINLYDFCVQHGIREIETLITDLQGMDYTVLKTLTPLIRDKKIREIQSETETDGTPSIHLNLPSNKFTEFKKLLSDDYAILWKKPDPVPEGWWEMDVRWRAKQKETDALVSPPDQSQISHSDASRAGNCLVSNNYIINFVYEHLKQKEIDAVHRGKVTVLRTPQPVAGADLYFYMNAHSFRGRQPGLNVLFLCEPIVVLPGEYDEQIWNRFDHVFTLFDKVAERDPAKFRKVSYYSVGSVTENMEERRKKYPLENRKKAICMISGNKRSSVPGELYSKRVEAALWFHLCSDRPFDVYGQPPFTLPNYRGSLETDAKLDTLRQYAYSLCFENTGHPAWSRGYITEKILDCLETRTIPIYLGASNIEKYIPPDCFIDFRKFRNYRDLGHFLHAMDNEQYEDYIENIDSWVSQGGLRRYSMHSIYDELVGLLASSRKKTAFDFFDGSAGWTSGAAPALRNNRWTATSGTQQWSYQALSQAKSPLIDYGEKAQGLFPDADTWIERASHLRSNSKFAEAAEAYEAALSVGFFNAQTLYQYSQLLIEMSRYKEALEQLQRVVMLDARHSLALNDIGALHLINKEFKQAVRYFHLSIEADVHNHSALENLFSLLTNLGLTEYLIQFSRSLLKQSPDDDRLKEILLKFDLPASRSEDQPQTAILENTVQGTPTNRKDN